jgi:hypothetical protein
MRRAITVIIATLGLVACSKGGGSASAKAGASAVASGGAGTSSTASTSTTSDNPGVDGPLMREGLWSIHSVTVENPGEKRREGNQSVCRNHAYDAHARTLENGPRCKTLTDSFTGGVMVKETECNVAGSVIRTKATATLTGDTSHSESHSTYAPAAYGVSESTMIMDEKYVGPCAAGTEPGDIMRADGTVMSRWKH